MDRKKIEESTLDLAASICAVSDLINEKEKGETESIDIIVVSCATLLVDLVEAGIIDPTFGLACVRKLGQSRG